MKARCPHDPQHDTFYAVVDVRLECRVTAEGRRLAGSDETEVCKVGEVQISNCAVCGSPAVFEED